MSIRDEVAKQGKATGYQRCTHRVLQRIQMKLILLCVWEERAVLGSTNTALEFKHEIQIDEHSYNSMYVAGYKFEKWKK